MGRAMQRHRNVAALSSVAVLSVLLTVSACSTDKTPEAFCEQLAAGNAAMEATVTNADASMSGQFGAAVTNIGEFTRMLKNLESHAPSEIETDMRAAVDAWERQAEAMSEAAEDPLGALAQSLSSAILDAASLRAVDAYASAHCGSEVFGTGGTNPFAGAPQVDVSEEQDPATLPAGPYIDVTGLTNGCPLLAGITTHAVALYLCDGGIGTTVDLNDGSTESITGLPTATELTTVSTVYIAGDLIVWADVTSVPATGLSLPTWTATVHLRDIHGDIVADTTVVTAGEGLAPDANMVQANGRGVLASYAVEGVGRQITFVTPDGEIAWERMVISDRSYFATRNTITLDTAILDVSTGSEVGALVDNNDAGAAMTSFCGDRFTLFNIVYNSHQVREYIQVRDDGASFSLANTPIWGTLTADGAVGETSEGLVGMNNDGAQTWAIPEDVLSSSNELRAFGHWLLVRNTSGVPVIVDAATGVEATPVDPGLAAVLALDPEWLALVAVDSDGIAWVRAPNDSGLYKIDYAELCG